MKNHKLLLGLVFLVAQIFVSKAQTITNYKTTDGLPSDNVLCLTADAANTMWFGTQLGVAKFDGTKWTIYNTITDSQIPNNSITAIASTSDNEIWIGTDFGAAVYNGTSWTKYTTVDGLGSNRINNIFETKNGDIWFSDFKGATKYDGNNFTTFGTADGLPFGGVQDIKEASNGDILMATGLGGLFVYDGVKFNSYTESNGLVSNSVSALALAQNGDVWIGTGDGMSIFNSDYNSIERYTRMYTIPPPDTLNPIEDIKIDSRGNVWVGIYVDYLVTVGGVAMFDGTDWINYDESDGIAGPTIRKIALDNNNNIWVGTSTGVSKIESPYLSVSTNSNMSIRVYPNPAKEKINICFNSIENNQSKIKILSISGRVIMEEKPNKKLNQSIDISHLETGVYYLKYGTIVNKFVVK